MTETIRVSDEDYERIAAAAAVLGLTFSEVVELGLSTDLLNESPRQNARRALQNYYVYILGQYDEPHEVPVEELTFEGPQQAMTALTIGQEKRESRMAKAAEGAASE
ncbi:hypothetical protein B4589_007775 [Halolamina sp. CBA1230]|uniref:hypothetical protein n=1 Tax=Halolamina sp. CBA1230 TaxID=1853690 RepID=UPI0009A202B0|nr:hypothetical protein [Halolamina sp. CBA1230]QKY20282.1 hypothetical protein B4589_007775 [Halolamina sp. CBA1230]